jgi:hypothetical protein
MIHNNDEFELLGEPRMTMAQFWIEEQLAEQEELSDQEIIQEWREREIPGDPPLYVENAIRREQVRLAEEVVND